MWIVYFGKKLNQPQISKQCRGEGAVGQGFYHAIAGGAVGEGDGRHQRPLADFYQVECRLKLGMLKLADEVPLQGIERDGVGLWILPRRQQAERNQSAF